MGRGRAPERGQEGTMERGGGERDTGPMPTSIYAWYLAGAEIPHLFGASVAESVPWVSQLGRQTLGFQARECTLLSRVSLRTQGPLVTGRVGVGATDPQDHLIFKNLSLSYREEGVAVHLNSLCRRHPGTPAGAGAAAEEQEEEGVAQGEAAAAALLLAGGAGRPPHPPSRRSTLPTTRGARRR